LIMLANFYRVIALQLQTCKKDKIFRDQLC